MAKGSVRPVRWRRTWVGAPVIRLPSQPPKLSLETFDLGPQLVCSPLGIGHPLLQTDIVHPQVHHLGAGPIPRGLGFAYSVCEGVALGQGGLQAAFEGHNLVGELGCQDPWDYL